MSNDRFGIGNKIEKGNVCDSFVWKADSSSQTHCSSKAPGEHIPGRALGIYIEIESTTSCYKTDLKMQ